MQKNRFQIFKHRRWKPADVHQLTGINPNALRNLRYRELISEPGGDHEKWLSLTTVAQLQLQQLLANHGFGPKLVHQTACDFSRLVVQHALAERRSWISDEAWEAWKAGPTFKTPAARYLVLPSSAETSFSTNDISDAVSRSREVFTVVDLTRAGRELAANLAKRPSDIVRKSSRSTGS